LIAAETVIKLRYFFPLSPSPLYIIYVANVKAVSLILNLADLSPGHSNLTHSSEAAVVMFPDRTR